jgi:hypothetical protein
MNATALARHYTRLTPEERFRLILAASGRGDEAERDRLANAGERIGLRVPGHSPFGFAFGELSWLTFIELSEAAAIYRDAREVADDALDTAGAGAGEHSSEEGAGNDDEQEGEPAPVAVKADAGERPVWVRALELLYVAGFMLRTKAEGWKLFCARLTVPPFLLWEGFPGFDRLQRALALAEKSAFTPEGFLNWLNTVRPAGQPELIEVPLTVESVADANEEAFRQRAAWWSG